MTEAAIPQPPPSPEYERVVNSSSVSGTGKIECFLMDVKTFIIKQIKQSAVELFVRSFDGYYYRFYMTHDPYFYLLPDTWNHAPAVKEELMEKCVNDWGGKLIKKIETGNYHVWGQFGDNFLQSSPALVVTTYYPTDVSKCRAIIEKTMKGVEGREWDIPFHMRVMIDWGLNPGKAYSFVVKEGFVHAFESMKSMAALPRIQEKCAFDIEVKKEQLKKPKPGDPINLLGYQYIDLGHVVNNVAVHKVELESFWMGVKDGKMTSLTPEEAEAMKGAKYKPVFFEAVNVPTEKDLIDHWRSFLVDYRPKVIGGYYCDKFDWNQLSENGKRYGINFESFLQFDKFEKAYTKDGYFFIDAIKFITRDSYLSKGNQSLKDVAKILLGIEPLEVDHEEVVHVLTKMEKEWGNPDSPEYDLDRCKKEAQALAYYSASDVYLTYILINTQVTDLDVSLSMIIPMGVFESARKARGPMVEAMMLKLMHEQGMIAPNKTNPPVVTVNPGEEVSAGNDVMVEYGKMEEKFWANCIDKRWMAANCKECKNFNDCKKAFALDPLVDKTRFFCQKRNEEMSVAPPVEMGVLKYKFEGAFVEAFNIGVFKDNCPVKITIKPAKLDTLQKKMKIAVLTEIKKMQSKGIVVDNVSKYLTSIDESFSKIRSRCKTKDNGDLEYYGLIAIIHIDVASMYPNIIITYNLQPHGVVTQTICDACPYHHADGEACCWIELPWKAIYVTHVIPPELREKADKALAKMKGEKGDSDKIRKKVYGEFIGRAVAAGKMKKPKKMEYTFKIPRTARFCQKAHKFFSRAVRDFRDKRYEFKYAEKDVYAKIEGIKEKWRDQLPPEMKENIKRLRERITAAEKEIEGILTMDVVNKNDVIKVVAETKKIKKEYKKVLEEWLGKIPAVMKSEIESLDMKAIFNRNSQLTYKVLLNAIYGWLDSAGARLLSIEVTGSTTIKGQDIIKWATDYMSDFALPIEIDTDGNWSAIPADLPREITIKGKDKDGRDANSKINVFNDTINADVEEKFTNYNNYKWDDKTQTFVNDPQCFIKFDYDGPFSMLFIQGEKRYTAYDRDKDDPTEQKIAEVKGMDRKRKGELPVIKAVEEWVDGAYKDASSYDEVYGSAVKAVETYVDQIKNRALDPHLLFEARDITSVSASQKAFSVLDELERCKKWDPEKVPQCTDLIKKVVSKDAAKKIESTFGKKLSTRHAWCCLRIVDLGIAIDDDEPVQWIISKFPANVGSITQRVVPTILFNADDVTVRKYLKRWIGYTCPEKFTMESLMIDIIDWDYYLERLAKKIHKIVLNPYSHQKGYITRKEIHDEVTKLKASTGVKQKSETPAQSSGGLLKFFARPENVSNVEIVERDGKSKPQFKGIAKIGKSYDLRDFL